MAAILSTERAVRRRNRIVARQATRPCARRAVAPETVPAQGPVALTPTRRGAESRGAPAGRGDAHFGDPRVVTVRNDARLTASPATFRRRRLVALLGLVAALAIVGQAGAALGGPSLGSPNNAGRRKERSRSKGHSISP